MAVRLFFVYASIFIALCVMNAEAVKIRLDQQGYFQGDIRLPKNARNGVLAWQRWPQATVYYEYANYWNQQQRSMVRTAMQEIEQNTCVRFVERTNQPHYVRIINDTGCYADAGYNKRVQSLSLKHSTDDRTGHCWYHEVIVHELLHSVGLWHEQQRKDRDGFIALDLNNVPQQWRFAFAIEQNSDTYGIPYDYESIMHYDRYAFSSNGQTTIWTNDRKYLDIIGRVKHGSRNDWEKVKRIYECSGTGGGGGGGGSGSPKCVDREGECAAWASAGHCSKNPGYMLATCYKSCYPSECSCVDTQSECAAWAARGECTRNPSGMNGICKKSCRQC